MQNAQTSLLISVWHTTLNESNGMLNLFSKNQNFSEREPCHLVLREGDFEFAGFIAQF